MANIFGGVEPPRWLERIATPFTQEETDRAVGMARPFLMGGVRSLIHGTPFQESVQAERESIQAEQLDQTDPLGYKRAVMESQIVAHLAQARNARNSAWLQTQKYASWLNDADKTAEIMAMPPEQLQHADTTGITNPDALKMIDTARNRAVQQITHRTNDADNRDFIKRRNALPPDLRPLVDQIIKKGDGTIPIQGYQTLDWLEAQAADRKRAEMEERRLNAIAAGDQVTTTDKTDTGTVRITPQKKTASALSDELYAKPPEVIEQGGHAFLKWGKQLRELKTDTAPEKALVEVAKHKINAINTQLANPNNSQPELQAELKAQLKTATDELMRFVKPAVQPATVPTSKPVSNQADPLGLFK